jgi:hypothetical protein
MSTSSIGQFSSSPSFFSHSQESISSSADIRTAQFARATLLSGSPISKATDADNKRNEEFIAKLEEEGVLDYCPGGTDYLDPKAPLLSYAKYCREEGIQNFYLSQISKATDADIKRNEEFIAKLEAEGVDDYCPEFADHIDPKSQLLSYAKYCREQGIPNSQLPPIRQPAISALASSVTPQSQSFVPQPFDQYTQFPQSESHSYPSFTVPPQERPKYNRVPPGFESVQLPSQRNATPDLDSPWQSSSLFSGNTSLVASHITRREQQAKRSSSQAPSSMMQIFEKGFSTFKSRQSSEPESLVQEQEAKLSISVAGSPSLQEIAARGFVDFKPKSTLYFGPASPAEAPIEATSGATPEIANKSKEKCLASLEKIDAVAKKMGLTAEDVFFLKKRTLDSLVEQTYGSKPKAVSEFETKESSAEVEDDEEENEGDLPESESAQFDFQASVQRTPFAGPLFNGSDSWQVEASESQSAVPSFPAYDPTVEDQSFFDASMMQAPQLGMPLEAPLAPASYPVAQPGIQVPPVDLATYASMMINQANTLYMASMDMATKAAYFQQFLPAPSYDPNAMPADSYPAGMLPSMVQDHASYMQFQQSYHANMASEAAYFSASMPSMPQDPSSFAQAQQGYDESVMASEASYFSASMPAMPQDPAIAQVEPSIGDGIGVAEEASEQTEEMPAASQSESMTAPATDLMPLVQQMLEQNQDGQ